MVDVGLLGWVMAVAGKKAVARPEELGQPFMAVAIFFCEPPRAPLIAAAGADIIAAVVAGSKPIDAEIVTKVGNVIILVSEAGPPALRPDIPDSRIRTPLSMCLGAPQRHSQPHAGP